MSEFHFLRPLWLFALLPLAGLSWQLIRLAREGGDWRRVCDPALLPYILVHDRGGKPARRATWLFTLGGALAILGLAGPVWERLPVPAFRNEAGLVIALDLSRIMDAADIKPSRLDRARFKIADLLQQRKDGLTALLVYSGDAFTVTPLTDDSGTINSQLSALTSDLMPTKGSPDDNRPDLALALAGRLLKQSGLTRGDILLITDGGGLSQADDAVKALRQQGYRVSVLGAGSEEGAPVPLPEGGFLQDRKGNIIISKLATPALRKLTDAGGGMYRKLSTDNADLAALLPFFDQQPQADQNGSAGQGLQVEQWEERGVWLLLLLLPIAALAFRRGYLVLLVLLVLPLPRTAEAWAWQDLWQTRDQQASQAFQAGDYAKSAEAFDNPAWKAAAQYKAGQFEEATKTLQGQAYADANYNLGNALAKQGQYPQAIAAYEQALTLDPKHEDARYNKELIEKAMKEQEKPENKRTGKGQGQNQEQQQSQDKGDGQPEEQNGEPKNQSKDKEQNKPEEQPGQQENPENAENQRQDQQGQQSEKPEPNQNGQNQGTEPASKPQPDPKMQPETEKKAMTSADLHQKEDSQAIEQWLRRIPDDPGGLLRRKFQYQYNQRQNQRGQQ